MTAPVGGQQEDEGPVVSEWVEYEGYHIIAPFLCMCCGEPTNVRQWAFGRACGKCDTGICQTWHTNYKPEYGHEKPIWWMKFETPRAEAIAVYMAHVNAEPVAPASTASPIDPEEGGR